MSQTLLLAPEGLFPIPEAESGKTNLQLSVAGTIQGEGILAGTPSLFLRLAGCNMACRWRNEDHKVVICDTPHALQTPLAHEVLLDEILKKIFLHRGNIRHLVITGGEPLLQASALQELLEGLRTAKRQFHITVESNGSLFTPALLPYVDLWSFSPKINATFVPEKRISTEQYLLSLDAWLHEVQLPAQIQLKFVVGAKDDEHTLLDFLSQLHLRSSDIVMLMPLGATPEELSVSTPVALEMAIRHGFRFAPRLQIMLWGNKVGV